MKVTFVCNLTTDLETFKYKTGGRHGHQRVHPKDTTRARRRPGRKRNKMENENGEN